jgi:DHA1 family bicyclomycin/chloramphenicol resistance-like MFS transporter
MLLAVVAAVPETLPVERRHGGGLRAFAVAGRQVLGNRGYVGYLLVAGSTMAALFAYVASSAFVPQSMSGLSPIGYSVDFAVNAAGMTLAALAAGITMLIGAAWLGALLPLVIVCFFVLMAAQGLILTNGGALASAAVPKHPGTGSAILGFAHWVARASSPRSPGSAENTPRSPWPY